MSKTQFKQLRPDAISWCEAWRDEFMAQMERAHKKRQMERLFTFAERAEKTAEWLKKANRADFAKWCEQIETAGVATIWGIE